MTWWDERLTSCRITPPRFRATIQLDCPFTSSLINSCFTNRPQWETKNLPLGDPCSMDCVLHWGEYEILDWNRVFRGEVICCCYCIRKGLIRKGHFAYNLKKWIAKRPKCELQYHVPETHILSIPDIDYFEEAIYDIPEVHHMTHGEHWIAKPSIINQGKEVFIFNNTQTLEAGIKQTPELQEWVIQRYIHPPLLIWGRKFHIRVYVLCIGNLEVFVWRDMLLLFASRDYDCELKELDDFRSHLTNTCLGENYQSRDSGDPVWLISELPEMLTKEEGMDLHSANQKVDKITRDIHRILGECFEAVSHEMNFLPLPNCFEFFGFDFLLDAEWNVWLLEANAEPDFKQTGERLRPKLEQMFEESFQIMIDPLTKSHPFKHQSMNLALRVANPLPPSSWTGVYKK